MVTGETYVYATATPYGDLVLEADVDDVQETVTEMREQIEDGDTPVELERTVDGHPLLLRYQEPQARELLEDMESWLDWVVS